MRDWNSILPHLRRDHVYYTWTGKFQSSRDVFVLCSLTRLLVLRWVDNTWQYMLIHGCCVKDRDMNDTRGVIRYGVYPLYRILSGERKGFFRPLHMIRPYEDSEEADRVLENRVVPQKRDKHGEYALFGQLLGQLIEEGAEEQSSKDSLLIPDFYISRSAEVSLHSLLVSPDKETRDMFQSLPEYHSGESLDEKLTAVKTLFSKEAGKRRVAFPWRYFYGKGVPVADPQSFNIWKCHPVETAEYVDPGLQISLKV